MWIFFLILNSLVYGQKKYHMSKFKADIMVNLLTTKAP